MVSGITRGRSGWLPHWRAPGRSRLRIRHQQRRRGEPGLRRNEVARSVSGAWQGKGNRLDALLGSPLWRRSIRSANGTLRSGSGPNHVSDRPRPCNVLWPDLSLQVLAGPVSNAGGFCMKSPNGARRPVLASLRPAPVQPTRARRDPRQSVPSSRPAVRVVETGTTANALLRRTRLRVLLLRMLAGRGPTMQQIQNASKQ